MRLSRSHVTRALVAVGITLAAACSDPAPDPPIIATGDPASANPDRVTTTTEPPATTTTTLFFSN